LTRGELQVEGSPEPRGIEGILDRIWTFLTRPWPAALAVFLVLLALVTANAQLDTDLFHRTAVGRLVESTGGVVHQDPFAFSPKLDAWVDHEWLSGVVFFQLARAGGDWALLGLGFLLMLFTVSLVVFVHRRYLGGERVLLPWLLLTLSPLFLVWVSVIRCRVFTLLLLSVLLFVLLKWKEGNRRWLWVLPPAFALWINLHGGVIAGLGLLGVAAVAASIEDLRRSVGLWISLLASGILMLLTPYGIDLWVYLLDAAVMDRPGIAEWESAPLFSFMGMAPLLLVGVVAMGEIVAEKRPSILAWSLIGSSLVATLWSQRLFTFLFLVLAIWGAPQVDALGAWVKKLGGAHWLAGRRVCTLLLLVLLAFVTQLSARNLLSVAAGGVDTGGLPVEAVEWLDQHGQGGKLLVHFNHGSFALWRLYPAYRVSVDGRYEEVYPQSTVDLSRQALTPGDSNQLNALAILDPDYILFPFIDREDAFPEEWKVVFESDLSQVLARDHQPLPEPRPRRGMWEPAF
jgi:hypothetical protein